MYSPSFYYLPSNATQCIITYFNDDILISVICPSHQKTVATNYVADSGQTYTGDVTIDVPELCLTHSLCRKQFSLHARKDGCYAPYILANVYEYGVICFGDVFDHEPHDLRQAWNYYWETSFNQENSSYYEYHQDNCIGKSSHTYAGHRERSCICACCLEICNCPCFCVQSKLFEDYLRHYKPRTSYASQSNIPYPIENENSLKLSIVSNKLLILPKEYTHPLGLNEFKYPDIFISVLGENDVSYFGQIADQQYQIPKAWFLNGNTQSDTRQSYDTPIP